MSPLLPAYKARGRAFGSVPENTGKPFPDLYAVAAGIIPDYATVGVIKIPAINTGIWIEKTIRAFDVLAGIPYINFHLLASVNKAR